MPPRSKRPTAAQKQARDLGLLLTAGMQAQLDAERAAKRARGRARLTRAWRDTKRTGKRLRSWRWRHRQALWPPVAASAVWLAGLAAAAAAPTSTVLLLVTAALALWVRVTWVWRDSDRRWACVPAVLGAAYLVALSAGVNGLDTVLLLVGAVTTGRWWWSYRVRGHQQTVAPPTPAGSAEPAAALEPDLSDLTQMWDDRVGGSTGALPRSRLSAVDPISNGREALIELDPGRQSTTEAMAATPRVTSALQQTAGSVVIEPTRSGRADQARLLVIDRNPMHEKHLWPGPSLDVASGTAPAGPHADGELARVRWLTPGSGPVNWLVAGSPGWGKSRFLDWALYESRAATYPNPQTGAPTPWVHTWLADGQQGQSVPDWLDIVAWSSTSTSETLRMVRAAKRVMDARSAWLARFPWVDDKGRQRRGLKGFDPALTGLPVLEVVIDECHTPLAEAPQLIPLLIDIARQGRKCGIRLVCATQIPSVPNLGGSIDLRALLSGNVVCFRTKDRISGGMAFAGGLDVDPHGLPEEFPDGSPAQGVAFVLGPGARPAPMRAFFVEDPYDAAELPIAPLHPVDVAAAGEDFARWRERRGLDDDDAPLPPVLSVAPDPASPVDATVRDVVLDVVRGLVDEHGRASRAQVIEVVGVQASLRSVTDALTQLTDGGDIVRVSRGVYGLPGSVAA